MAWLPGVERIPGNDGGSMTGGGARKLLLHTTEGGTIEGAVAAFKANNSWPHLTVDCVRRRVVQHLDFNVAARSLKNLAGGVQTNRGGTILVQVELVGFAQNPATIGTDADLAWFGRSVVKPTCDLTGFPCVSNVEWVAFPASFGSNARQRLTGGRWDAYSGVLGHQHAPENDHGDPGAIDVARILAAATGHTEEQDMTPDESAKLDAIFKHTAGDGRLKGVYTDTAGDGRLKEVTLAVRKLLEQPAPSADEIAAAVVAKLPSSSGGAALTKADVTAAVREVFAEVRYTIDPADIVTDAG